MNKIPDLIGIVMCGGKSMRMGTDKGLLKNEKQYWAKIAFDKISTVSSFVKISVSASQLERYEELFSPNLLLVDGVEIPGPLAGILTAHTSYQDSDFLILACDMTDIHSATILQLIEIYKTQKYKYDFFVFNNKGAFEPLLGIYTSKGLQKISKMHAKGMLEKYSMKYVLEISDTYSISVGELQQKEFKNYNLPTDL